MSFQFDFTPEQLEYNIPKNREHMEWYSAMCEFLPKYDIVTVTRVAGFISQCAHESLDFTRTLENLNYSAQRLNQVFPKYFARAGRNASHYHRQPEKIANVVYANRMDNGDENSGDGWRFRGRGLIQLTGRYNYTQFGNSCGMTAEQVIPYVETKRGAIHSACWYWSSRNLNQAADAHDVNRMTRLINGGTHGLRDRQIRYTRAMNSLGKSIDKTKNLRTVKLGSRGKTVAMMQEYLGIPADGIFGPNTEATLKRWQQFNGLTPDGIAGPNTLAKMFKS
jgi:putative chitinase